MFELIFNFLNGAEMSKDNNIESLLDQRIKNSLNTETTEMFPDEVMKRIFLNLEFEKEDKKTFKFAGIISVSVIAVMFIIAATISTLIGFGNSDDAVTETDSFIQNIYNFLSNISSHLFSIIGFQGTADSFLYVILISFVVLIFFFADRIILGKRNQ